MMTKRKIIVVGQLPNFGKFESGYVLSPAGVCRALKARSHPPFIEVEDGQNNRSIGSKQFPTSCGRWDGYPPKNTKTNSSGFNKTLRK